MRYEVIADGNKDYWDAVNDADAKGFGVLSRAAIDGEPGKVRVWFAPLDEMYK